MEPSVVLRALKECFGRPRAFALAGEGDYCYAFGVEGGWTFLFAKHPFAFECLTRVARVSPKLVVGTPLLIPVVEHYGQADSLAYVGYKTVPGTELTASEFAAMDARVKLACAERLAAFFVHIHTFDLEAARQAGVRESEYPFPMREEEFVAGEIAALFESDLNALGRYPQVEKGLADALANHLGQYLTYVQANPQPLVLLHGEVSGDHVLYEPKTADVVGIIDFNGMFVGRPARDFLYLYEEYGAEFASDLLRFYGGLDSEEVMSELRFLRLWHTLLRLLWALEHQYQPGIERWWAELKGLAS